MRFCHKVNVFENMQVYLILYFSFLKYQEFIFFREAFNLYCHIFLGLRGKCQPTIRIDNLTLLKTFYKGDFFLCIVRLNCVIAYDYISSCSRINTHSFTHSVVYNFRRDTTLLRERSSYAIEMSVSFVYIMHKKRSFSINDL